MSLFLDELRARLPLAGSELLLALDIDGTILHHDTSLTPRVAQAIHAHQARGTQIVLATGRGTYATLVALNQLGIESGVAVCSNGALTITFGEYELPSFTSTTASFSDNEDLTFPSREGFPAYTVIDVHTFDPSKEVMSVHAALPEALLAVEAIDGPRRVTQEFPPGELTGPNLVLPASEIAITDATRFTVRAPEMSSQELLDAIAKLGLRGVDYAVGWTAWLDITPAGVTKAAALERIRKALGMGAEATLAVGDGGNDIDMLMWAHVGVAMGGSSADVQASADFVGASVDEDGLAEILEALL